MALVAGTRLGVYEIVAPIGAGGMGEVYRARDARLARDVAVKVLPARFAADADMLRRFELEARAAGGLNHPNILAIHDIGAHDGAPYVVCELLEGTSLRGALAAGPLPPRTAVDYAVQVAQGLAAAHGKGVVHRDLKPENLFVTRDGRVKILDFGLAKMLPRAAVDDAATGSLELGSDTSAGTVLGTVGYMSPEQARGEPADHRSDVFSFGTVVYEMLAGQRAFTGPSAVEILHAIIRGEPSDLPQDGRVPPAIERIVRRCLQKQPDLRFQSVADLAFALDAARGATGTSGPTTPASSQAAVATAAPPRRPLPRLVGPALSALMALAAAAAGALAHRYLAAPVAPPVFKQATFERGTVLAARFAGDGQTIVYSAASEGAPSRTFTVREGNPESRPLGLPDSVLAGVSASGDLAVKLVTARTAGTSGTLARVPLGGGAPRELLEAVASADWSPDGRELAVVRTEGGRHIVEYPMGIRLYETPHRITGLRVSPRGDLVACFESDEGRRASVVVIDRGGHRRALSRGWSAVAGLCWSGAGEVWFSASDGRQAPAIRAVDLQGRERVVLRTPGALWLYDIGRDGRVLLAENLTSPSILSVVPGSSKEVDLAWMDGSVPADLSADGHTLLFSEARAAGGPGQGVYVRRGGSAAIRLGEGYALALSPDGGSVLALLAEPPRLVLYPTGAGTPRQLPPGGVEAYETHGRFSPDGKRVLFVARAPGQGLRAHVQDLAGGPPRAFGPEGIERTSIAVSPDGKRVAFVAKGLARMVTIDGGGAPGAEAEGAAVPGAQRGEVVARWNQSGSGLLVYRPGPPMPVTELDVTTGARRTLREITPADPVGATSADRLLLTPDGGAYAYGLTRYVTNVFLVEGLR